METVDNKGAVSIAAEEEQTIRIEDLPVFRAEEYLTTKEEVRAFGEEFLHDQDGEPMTVELLRDAIRSIINSPVLK